MRTRRLLIAALTLLLTFHSASVHARPVAVGTTFSDIQCRYLDLNEKKTYFTVLGMGFDMIRLGAYWNEIEKNEDDYDFSGLDWQIEQAKASGVPVILTVGMKAPRWPEYHIPEWALSSAPLSFGAKTSENGFIRQRTLKFITEVIKRYKAEDIIKYWQVENEPLNRFGGKHWYIGKDFLREEVELVKELDGRKRPIILTVATYPNIFLRIISRFSVPHDPVAESVELCDILGLNVYPIVGQQFLGIKFYFRSNEKTCHSYYSKLLDAIKSKDKEIWITELQAEPWEPGHLAYKNETIPVTGDPRATKKYFKDLTNLEIDAILLWGAEYWIFRKERYNDNSWIQAVESILPR